MMNSYRREHILDHLNTHNRLIVSDIAENLKVSDETVRRDLINLEHEGLLRRVHGGAIGVSPNRDKPISERAQKQAKEKTLIAKLAVDLISDHTSIFLHIGSTTEELARQLSRFTELKVYTNSLNVAKIAREHFGVTVFVAPGRLRKVEFDLVGSDTISYIQNYYFDCVFMSVAGIDADRGFMDFEEDEARIRQALLNSANNKVMMVDSSKFGKKANMITASFDQIDRLVTDQKPNKDFQQRFTTSGVAIMHG